MILLVSYIFRLIILNLIHKFSFHHVRSSLQMCNFVFTEGTFGQHGARCEGDFVCKGISYLIQRPQLAQLFNCGGNPKGGSKVEATEKRNFMGTQCQKAILRKIFSMSFHLTRFMNVCELKKRQLFVCQIGKRLVIIYNEIL